MSGVKPFYNSNMEKKEPAKAPFPHFIIYPFIFYHFTRILFDEPPPILFGKPLYNLA